MEPKWPPITVIKRSIWRTLRKNAQPNYTVVLQLQGNIKRSKHVMKRTNEELSYQYAVTFITDLEFAITLVFKKPIAILTSTSTIDINVPTSET